MVGVKPAGVVAGGFNQYPNRAASASAQAVQINTGGECHLNAIMFQEALPRMDLSAIYLLIF